MEDSCTEGGEAVKEGGEENEEEKEEEGKGEGEGEGEEEDDNIFVND